MPAAPESVAARQEPVAAAAVEPPAPEPVQVQVADVAAVDVAVAALPTKIVAEPQKAELITETAVVAEAAADAAPADVFAPATVSEEAPTPIPPSHPQFIDPHNPPVTVVGYVRPPGRDVPGLIRAHSDEAEDVQQLDAASEAEATPAPVVEVPAELPPLLAAAAATEPAAATSDAPVRVGRHARPPSVAPTPPPLFSNEGVVRAAAQQSWATRARATAAGIGVALLAAGTAFGHSAGPRLASVKDRIAGGAGSVDGNPPAEPEEGAPAASSAVVTPGVGVTLPSVFAPVGRVLALPVVALSRWMSGGEETLTYDEYGNEHRRRRMGPGWLLFIGFYGALFALIALTMMFSSQVAADGGHPVLHTPIAGAGGPGSSPSAGGNVVIPGGLPGGSPSASAVLSPSPTPVAATPTPTETPTEAPTATPTAAPTAKVATARSRR